MSAHPIRFGVMVESHHDQSQWFTLAKRAEELGYSTFLVRDHLAPDYFGPQFAPLVALASLIGVTERLRFGTVVIDNDFRHPVILAKEAATIDVLSGGRFELGIGAGWLRNDYAPTGITYDPNPVRIDRLAEALPVLKSCFTEEEVSFCGQHYQLDQYSPFPRPCSIGGPRLMIGAGKPRMLRIAGRYADIVGLLTTSVSSGEVEENTAGRSIQAVQAQIALIREGAGDRFDDIELSIFPTIQIAESPEAGFAQIIASNGWMNTSVADVRNMAAVFAGTPDEVANQMLRRRSQLGLSYFVINDAQMEALAPVVARISGL